MLRGKFSLPVLLGRVAALGVLAAAIGACSDSTEVTTVESPSDRSRAPSAAVPSSTGESPGSVRPSVIPSAGPDPSNAASRTALPQVGDCYDYSTEELEQISSSEGPTPCTTSHTAETYRVVDWPFDTSPHAMSPRDRHKVAEQTCLPITDAAAGILTYWAFYVPNTSEWDQGQRWLRCDGMVSLNESRTAFAQWTGSVIGGDVREVLPQTVEESPTAPKWKALASPPSNPTYVILKRVVPQSDGSFLLTVDPVTPNFQEEGGDGCRPYYVKEPREGFFCLGNVTEKDRKVTLKPNAGIYYGDSSPLEMSEFMLALEQQPANVAIELDTANYAEVLLAVPM